MEIKVKTKEIEINIKGNPPNKLLNLLRKEYGSQLIIKDALPKRNKKTSPAEALKHYRKLNHMSQAELGEKMGGIPKQHISNMENGSRAISIESARKLSNIFKVSIENFL